MADLTVADVKQALEARGIVGSAEDELVETTHRLNALLRGIDRLEASESVGDVEAWRLVDPERTGG